MTTYKRAMLGAVLALAATPAFSDVTMLDVMADYEFGKIISGEMDGDAKSHLFNITISSFGVVDKALGSHAADYEVVLANRGMQIGAALYDQHDASYDAVLFPEAGGCQTGLACF